LQLVNSFRGIAREREPQSEGQQWTPPAAARWIGAGILLCFVAVNLLFLWHAWHILQTADPNGPCLASPPSLSPVFVLIPSFSIMPAVIGFLLFFRRRPPARKKHVPDPNLSIFPR
jgi:hypothetical protein